MVGRPALHDKAPPGVDVVSGLGEGEWGLVARALEADVVHRLQQLDRPIRFMAARWSNAAVELVERLDAAGVTLDYALIPTVLGGTVRYWNSKIGMAEVLNAISGVRGHIPPSTVVASPAEAIAVTGSFGGPTVLKANDAIGGVGVVALDESTTPSSVRSQLAATADDAGTAKRSMVNLNGPYILQGVVGSAESWSPSLDFLVQADDVSCIAAAEQVLEGFLYRGARFPGRTDEAGLVRCGDLGLLVGHHLRGLGYRGLLNVDFVVDGDDVWLIELNARQSAPLDQSFRTTAALGPNWRQTRGFEFLEVDGVLTWL